MKALALYATSPSLYPVSIWFLEHCKGGPNPLVYKGYFEKTFHSYFLRLLTIVVQRGCQN